MPTRGWRQIGALQVGADFQLSGGRHGTVIGKAPSGAVQTILDGKRVGIRANFAAEMLVKPTGTRSPNYKPAKVTK